MNSFGRLFRMSIFGESHGEMTGVLIDGCPPGIELKEEDFLPDIERRKAGITGTSSRTEKDIPKFSSGIYKSHSSGAPILITFENENFSSEEYKNVENIPRPGHADFAATRKYEAYNDLRGGGHFSGRLSLPLVAVGVIAKKIINPILVKSRILTVNNSPNIEQEVQKALLERDSIGGVVECRIENVPIGLGEPFFDSIESIISHLIFSIPAVKGIEFGAGFNSAAMKGSEMNDVIADVSGKTKTNNSGGINGGISNGNPIVFRLAVKPASSIGKAQTSINLTSGKMEDFEIHGRHDTCIALRMPPIFEAVAAIALADFMLINKSYSK